MCERDEERSLRFHLGCNYIDMRGYDSIPFTDVERVNIDKYINAERHRQISELSHTDLVNLVDSALAKETLITEETIQSIPPENTSIKYLTNFAKRQVYREMTLLRLRELMEYYQKTPW